MNIENYNFNLPEDLIANQPSIKRSDSKLLVVQENLIDEKFKSIINYLKEGDLLVLNDTKVFNARLTANKQTGGKVEILLERQLNEFAASAITKTNRPLKKNEILQISDSDVTAVIVEKIGYLCKIEFSRDLETIIDTYGTIPIPPYMNRESNIMD